MSRTAFERYFIRAWLIAVFVMAIVAQFWNVIWGRK